MAVNIVGPHGPGANPATARPTDTDSGASVDTWFAPCTNNDPNTGTKVTAVWLNKVTALFRRAIRGMGVAETETDDDMLLKAIQKADRAVVNVGAAGSGVYAGIDGAGQHQVRKIKAGANVTLTQLGGGELEIAAAAAAGVAAGVLVDMQTLTANATWSKPAGATKVLVLLTGGGGGGGVGTPGSSLYGSGGGGAAETRLALVNVSAITDVAVTVGAGGAIGANGGDSTFGAHATAKGGNAPVATHIGGSGGTGGSGGFGIAGGGGHGVDWSSANNDVGGTGGASFWGGGAAGGHTISGTLATYRGAPGAGGAGAAGQAGSPVGWIPGTAGLPGCAVIISFK